MGNDSKTGDRLSRRKMLALTLSGTAAGIAGCTGGGGGNDTTTSGGGGESTDEPADTDAASGATTTAGATGTTGMSSSGTNEPAGTTGTAGNESGGNGSDAPGTVSMSPDQMADSVVDMNIEFLLGDANWNHRSTGPASWFFPFDYTGKTYWNGETDWWLLEEDGYTYDGESQTVTYDFREEYGYWWNGDPVTAKDYMIQREINRLIDPEGSSWENWELEDDYTLVGTRKEQINPILIGVSGNANRVFEYRGAWRQWLERLQDATTADARDTIVTDLSDWSISSEMFANDGLGNGTYRLDEWSTTEVTWKRFEDHPYADQVPFPTVKWHVGKGSSKNQQISNDTIDVGINNFPKELRKSSPDYLQELYNHRSIQSRNLLFNYQGVLGQRNVRRALVSILDFTTLVDFWHGKGGFVKQHQTGLPQRLEDKWLGEELVESMVDYPLKSDPDRAAQFMEKAGYSKEGGTWIGPDGDSLQFTLMIGANLGTSQTLGKAITRSWSQWGADVEFKPVTNSQYVGNINSASGDWDVGIWLHGFNVLNPMNYFDTTSSYQLRLGPSASDIEKWLDNGKTHSPANGKPLKPTIPTSPGLAVDDNGGEQVNLYELVEELRTTQDKKRSRDIIRTLSRYFNYDLPMFDMFPQATATWGDTRDFEWPDDANVWYQKSSRAAYSTIRKGLIKPVPGDQ